MRYRNVGSCNVNFWKVLIELALYKLQNDSSLAVGGLSTGDYSLLRFSFEAFERKNNK